MLVIERNGVEEWSLCLAPQCVTDILVHVFRGDPGDNQKRRPEFTFCIGELLREQMEGFGCLDGLLNLDDDEVANIERWATQIEAYAAIMRSALRSRRPAPPPPEAG